MSACFADTYYFLALRNPKDLGHTRATALTEQIAGRTIITTAWVLTEVADALASPENRAGFIDLLEKLRSNAQVIIVSPSEGLFERGIDLYRQRPDKAWSLTDCISFVVMRERGLVEALTGDHHFEQAGFRPLLK